LNTIIDGLHVLITWGGRKRLCLSARPFGVVALLGGTFAAPASLSLSAAGGDGLLGGGEVLQLVDSPCSEMHVRVVSLQVCQALGFVHSHGIVHRDVKAENIVFSGRGVEVKLIDFGLAGFEADDEEMMKRCGSPGYIAPEVIGGERCSFVADIFGLGVVTYLLIAGQLPFPGKTMEDILKKNIRCQVRFEDDIWFGLEEARSFVMSLLAKDVNSRPAAGEVWRHPWLACLLTEG